MDFGDICDTCVLTGNRAVGELLREIRENRPCHRRVVIIVMRPVPSNPASSSLSTHRSNESHRRFEGTWTLSLPCEIVNVTEYTDLHRRRGLRDYQPSTTKRKEE